VSRLYSLVNVSKVEPIERPRKTRTMTTTSFIYNTIYKLYISATERRPLPNAALLSNSLRYSISLHTVRLDSRHLLRILLIQYCIEYCLTHRYCKNTEIPSQSIIYTNYMHIMHTTRGLSPVTTTMHTSTSYAYNYTSFYWPTYMQNDTSHTRLYA
jgi:hypothetical protein